MNSTLKILKGISVEYMECPNEDVKKNKQGQILCIIRRDDQIATSVTLLDIMHKPYGFSADLIETIN